jgi:hypothetical protein
MSGLRRLVMPLGAMVLFVSAALLSAPTAQAASCSGTSCYKKNPQSSGCNVNTRTLGSLIANGYYYGEHTSRITAELRWTANCAHVAWMRISSPPGAGPSPAFKVESCTSRCTVQYTVSTFPYCTDLDNNLTCNWGTDHPWWSAMVPTGNKVVRLCGADVSTDSRGTIQGPWGCTSWF